MDLENEPWSAPTERSENEACRARVALICSRVKESEGFPIFAAMRRSARLSTFLV